jgi:thymidylate kinase
MQSSSKKIIEVCGLPGSGKTTLARKLGAEGIERVMVVTKIQILRNYFLGFMFHPLLYVRGLCFAVAHTKTLAEFWNFYMYRFARYSKAVRSCSSICLLDEGPLQSVFSYAAVGVSTAKLQELVSLLPASDMTILLSIDEVVRQRQLEERKQVRPEHEFRKIKNSEADLLQAETALRTMLDTTPEFVVVPSVEKAAEIIKAVHQ